MPAPRAGAFEQPLPRMISGIKPSTSLHNSAGKSSIRFSISLNKSQSIQITENKLINFIFEFHLHASLSCLFAASGQYRPNENFNLNS
jgi:hypothetical protein